MKRFLLLSVLLIFQDKGEFIDNPLHSLQRAYVQGKAETTTFFKLEDARMLRLVSANVIGHECLLLVFDHIKTDSLAYDMQLVFGLPDKTNGLVRNVTFQIKKNRIMRYYPHEPNPERRFEYAPFSVTDFENYIGQDSSGDVHHEPH